MKPKLIKYNIYSPGESAAGISSFSDVLDICVLSGDPGGEDGEFEEFLRGCLSEWFDGAKVILIEGSMG